MISDSLAPGQFSNFKIIPKIKKRMAVYFILKIILIFTKYIYLKASNKYNKKSMEATIIVVKIIYLST